MLVTVVGRLVEQGGIGGLAGSESESESELSLGGPGGWEATGIIFLGSFRSLEFLCWKRGSLCQFAFLDFLYLRRY